jgi:hypothetical protein
MAKCVFCNSVLEYVLLPGEFVCMYVYEYVYGQMCILQQCSRICVVT